jgi:hypothetical protein
VDGDDDAISSSSERGSKVVAFFPHAFEFLLGSSLEIQGRLLHPDAMDPYTVLLDVLTV